MIIRTITGAVYALVGVLYLLVGAGSSAPPAGWSSLEWVGNEVGALYRAAPPAPYLNHLTQEFGMFSLDTRGSSTTRSGQRRIGLDTRATTTDDAAATAS